jgi:hypothetical protein
MSQQGIALGQFDDSTMARLPEALEDALRKRDERREAAEQDIHEASETEEEEGEEDALAHMRGEFDANLALKLTDFQLAQVSMELIRGIDSDLQSRTEWEGIAQKAIDYLGLKMEAASTDVTTEGSVSKVFHTLLLESSVYFWANAHAELLPASGPCKVMDDKPVEPKPNVPPMPPSMPGMGQVNPNPMPANGMPAQAGSNQPFVVNRGELASAFEADMNHYLTAVDRQYYRDFSRMLFSLGPMGTEFRKVYWCPQRKRPVSEWVKGINLIVSNDAADLSTATRVTERIKMRQSAVKRLQIEGWWRNIPLSTPSPTVDKVAQAEAQITGINLQSQLSADYQHTIYECYCELDLPGFEHEDDLGVTGLPLPYRVTIDRDSKQVLEIRRNWKEGDSNYIARKRYVMYGMIPGLGFYYLGYIHVLGNTQRALTAIERQLLDAGQYANFPGFLYAKGGMKNDNSDIRIPPGGGREINTGDKPIGNVVMALPYKDISPGLLKLMETLSSDGRKLSSIAEMPVGEGRADVPVGTVVAMIEQTTKVTSAVHKGLHASMMEELLLLKEQFAEDPTALWAFAKTPARKWEQAEEFNDIDLVPASDPNIPSQLHRTTQSMALMQVAQQVAPLGILNLKEVTERVLRTLNIPNLEALFQNPTIPPQAKPQGPQQPPPDPSKMANVQLKAVEQQRKAASEQQNVALQKYETDARIAAEREDRIIKMQIAAMNARSSRERLAAQLHKTSQDHYNRQLDRQSELTQAHHDRVAKANQEAMSRLVDLHTANLSSKDRTEGSE